MPLDVLNAIISTSALYLLLPIFECINILLIFFLTCADFYSWTTDLFSVTVVLSTKNDLLLC